MSNTLQVCVDSKASQHCKAEHGMAVRRGRCALQMSREVSQLRSQQVKLRAVCESEVQRAASDATSGVEGLQLRWRQVIKALHVIRRRHASQHRLDALAHICRV